MRKIYVCPRCKGVNWKISFDEDLTEFHYMICSKCGRWDGITFASEELRHERLDTIDLGFENTGMLTDNEKEINNGCF